MDRMKVNIGGLEFQNPVSTASGTFAYGLEFDKFVDLNRLGAVFLTATTLEHREGNDYPRMAETSAGMLNAVGLQNRGVDHFINEIYPKIKDYNTHMIVNLSGSTIDDYVETAEKLAVLEHIPAIELNISCPNVREGGMAFGTSCVSAAQVTREVRKAYPKPLIVKLSPNVTDIVEIAQTVEEEGADAVSLVNTFLGMAVDAETRTPKLSTITGGLSGPAIKPIALRMVWQVYNAVKIPVVGLGGITNATDAIEFMLAGASAIQIGTYNFVDPQVSMKVIDGIAEYLDRHQLDSVHDIIGQLKV